MDLYQFNFSSDTNKCRLTFSVPKAGKHWPAGAKCSSLPRLVSLPLSWQYLQNTWNHSCSDLIRKVWRNLCIFSFSLIHQASVLDYTDILWLNGHVHILLLLAEEHDLLQFRQLRPTLTAVHTAAVLLPHCENDSKSAAFNPRVQPVRQFQMCKLVPVERKHVQTSYQGCKHG